ncbi:MAG: bifunctional acetate--CoA ligase family protein/GNAT family N-acetyltransferase [Saprospiraceae bacterium]|nr:bifunctional acetate--CoA ligase family protein/GNAT family N-acetyltransferase [Saprospiraceae bacterium]MDP4998231.1 bifunctional acetate--CoA ligase family protein/GNAT family N-acetyltransferase [Saprospiraceae bacterium]
MKRTLDKIFYPKTIAAIGASNREGSIGFLLMQNLISGSFKGKIYPVNPKYNQVQGYLAYRSIRDIQDSIDLAIIATPARTVPKIVRQCGRSGITGIVILSSGFRDADKHLWEDIRRSVKKYGLRVIGPDSLGFIHPALGLNATFAPQTALPGKIAFISQSGALCNAILDWSGERNFGFSHFVSIGSMIDTSYHDLIDYFGADGRTACILIYMETLTHARAFMSAARAFARSKPIIVLKPGKSKEGALTALSHTGNIAGEDAAFEAAFKRAGIVRVNTVAALFNLAQAFAMQPYPKGNRLAIISNAGGPAILATDYLVQAGGQPARLSAELEDRMHTLLPKSWTGKQSPADEVSVQEFAALVEDCLAQENVDGALVILTPQAAEHGTAVAKAMSAFARKYPKTLLACWMGSQEVKAGKAELEAHQIPVYRFPESAVEVFMNMFHYKKNIDLLYETPGSIPQAFSPNKEKAALLIQQHLSEGRYQLDQRHAMELLACYDIRVNQGVLVQNGSAAADAAAQMGYPVAAKIASPDILHKTEAGGVQLDLRSPEEVVRAVENMLQQVQQLQPQAKIEGILIEKMCTKRHELLIGAKRDEVFGPLIVFGMGGIAVDIFKDQNAGIPPLNMALARHLIQETKIYALLQGYRKMPGINIQDLLFLLYRFAYLVMDFPQILEIDINPFAIDEHEGIVIDASVILDPKSNSLVTKPYQHLVISPYPRQYIKTIVLRNGTPVTLRPIRPEDEPLEAELFDYLSKETIYFRFFGYLHSLDHNMLSRFTHIDYDREMAIVAEIESASGKKHLIGVVRCVGDAWNDSTENAIVIADTWQGQGLGSHMMAYIIEIARASGYRRIYGTLLKQNKAMYALYERHGFRLYAEDHETFTAELLLQ